MNNISDITTYSSNNIQLNTGSTSVFLGDNYTKYKPNRLAQVLPASVILLSSLSPISVSIKPTFNPIEAVISTQYLVPWGNEIQANSSDKYSFLKYKESDEDTQTIDSYFDFKIYSNKYV